METKKSWILVVDDDDISLKNARDSLNREEFRVSSVHSGRELLQFCQKNKPDLILLDVMMPEMDGFEAYQKLCEYEDQNSLRHIPVIFLTGEMDPDTEQKGLMIGASDFIRKPIIRDVLLRRVRNILANVEKIDNLTEEAMTDKLTGFYNKAYADEKMKDICKANTGMLIILDLDSFKLVNDLYGHDMGDNVLAAFADIARRNCSDKDIFCRIGGDEFLLFLTDTIDEKTVYSYVLRLNEQLLDACIRLMGAEFDIPIGVSAGGVTVSESGDYSELFQLADKALYRVKQNGKHSCRFYELGEPETEGSFVPDQELYRMIALCAERGKAESAMVLGQDEFISVYRYMERLAQRHKEEMVRVLLYIMADEAADKKDLMDAMSLFGDIIQSVLRKNDVITQSKYNSYFLLLSEYERPEVQAVINHITEKWEQTEFADKYKIGYVST